MLMTVWACDKIAGDPNKAKQKSAAQQPKEKPIVIWYYHSIWDTPKSLQIALSSGLVTHVTIAGTLHRKDRDYRKNRKTLDALKITKGFGAKVIWVRDLWPLYNIEDSRAEDLFDPNYYIQEIQILRSEANEVGADFVMLDTEPYGHATVKKYLHGQNRLDYQKMQELHQAINKAIGSVGKVDFIRPGGGPRRGHPAQILARLGKYRFSGVARSGEALRHKPPYEVYPYEIFSAYLNTVKKERKNPNFSYFRVPEIFQNSHIWSDRRGLFLYPRERNTMAVAKELVAFAKSLPSIDSIKRRDPNSDP